MDGEVRPVEERDERVRRRASRCRRATSFLRLLEELLRPVRLGVLAGLDEVEVGRRRRAGPSRALAEIASRTSWWASSPNGRRCCGFGVRVLRSVSWSVHSWSETMPFHGASTSCSPSSIALARTTSSSAVSRATLPISLRYIRTGSSIPIMSAQIASSSSAVGSSSSAGVELRRRVGRQLVVDRLAVLADDLDADVAAVGVGEPVGRARRPARGRRRPRRPRPRRQRRPWRRGRLRVGELRLLDVRLGPTRAGEYGFDQLLVQGIAIRCPPMDARG